MGEAERLIIDKVRDRVGMETHLEMLDSGHITQNTMRLVNNLHGKIWKGGHQVTGARKAH